MATNRNRNRGRDRGRNALPITIRQPRKASRFSRKVTDVTPQQLDAATRKLLKSYLTASGQYKTRRGKVRSSQSVLPVLPQLGSTTATPTPAQLQQLQQLLPGIAAAPSRRPGESTAQTIAALRRFAWRYRWQLAPAAATVTTATGAATAPIPTILGLGMVASAGFVTAAKGPDEIGGRKWLSRIERTITARWAVSAAVWTAGVGTANGVGVDWSLASVAVAASALASLTGAPTVAWLGSRRIRKDGKPAKRSAAARQLVAAWPTEVSLAGPDGLVGSYIVDVAEPDPGTIVVDAQLREGVHAETVANDETRRWLERALHMGVGTAKVELRRDHAGQIRVVLTPTRHLEKVSKAWPGPVLFDDGRIPTAVTPDGQEICIRAYAENAVRHLVIIGSSGSGKTNTYNVLLLPTVLARKSVLIYLDGKGGTSSPALARAMDMVARKPHEWAPAICMVHRIAMSRQDRYGELGLDDFDPNNPLIDDPIIDLVVDEGSSIARALDDEEQEKFVELAERGRSLGVRVLIGVQTPNADQFPGGIAVRNNLMGSAGYVVGLRPGGGSAKSVTLTSTSAEIDLLGLPEGGGWAAILAGGVPAADKARILWVPKGAVDKHLDGFVPRTLTGDDAVAAGETYANRHTGAQWFEAIQAARARRIAGIPTTPAANSETQASAAETRAASAPTGGVSGVVSAVQRFKAAQRAASRQSVLNAIRSSRGVGVTSAELVTELGLSKSTVNRIIGDFIKAGDAERGDDNRVRLVAADEAAA